MLPEFVLAASLDTENEYSDRSALARLHVCGFSLTNMTAGCVAVPRIIPIRKPLPGKAKHEIDTATPVEIKSDTSDVSVFFTLDGTKPDLNRRPGGGAVSTIRYSSPVCLPAGKVIVKALAVRCDGRESGVVTKVFLVEPAAQGEEDDPGDVQGDGGPHAAERAASAENRSGDTPGVMRPPSGATLRTSTGPRFLSQRLGHPPPPGGPSQHTKSGDPAESPFRNLTHTHMSRIQRETDFLRCATCLSHRPSDPFARFCLNCGATVPPVPGQRLPPTEGGQMAVCVSCKALVPVNTSSCVVCEAPMAPQLQPQASHRLQDKMICQSCGTGNPAHISYCVTCEARLPQPATPVFSGHGAPPLPNPDGRMISCSKCRRLNHSDARFCDWCGAKPGHVARYLTCSRCGSSSHPYANFCGRCGVFLEGPQRLQSRCSSAGGALEQKQMAPGDAHSAVWQVAPAAPGLASLQTHAADSMDAETQTVGLFYPSATQLHKRDQQEALEQLRQETMRDRRPPLTAISPGRGYWRKQMDHICSHLRSYTQNNLEFRGLVGEPRMGQMVSAMIEEDNVEVSLRINFVAATPDKSKAPEGVELKKPMALSEIINLSSVTEGATHNTPAAESGPTLSSPGPKKSLRTQKRPTEKQPPIKDSLLLKEVGPEGRGRVEEVQRLLEEGADPSCRDSKGHPALVVATTNGHHEVIPVLVQRGADINHQSGLLSNTALHVAAAMGNRGLKSAETLLGCNASLKKKNSRRQTAYDVAVSSDCRELLSLIAARAGQGLLDRLTKPRTPSGLDMF
ncbi:double zinc ribbon and ankyrin repeat-containing protein 1 [Clupea harengus]|uniref:Double zinc ribbon and ankyrin repeat-containing protein 1 n=1 Tax=Clupea harengus TaxID=7950 RepID=A0A6P8F3V9_CLUHA|nr:double zinc ribbon and ankyrin repeat-containing protein 1 [Clupea harengus]